MTDYAKLNKIYWKQKAALTRAIKSGDPKKLVAECRKAVQVWNTEFKGAWPDDWARWQRALDDKFGMLSQRLEDI